MTYTLTQVLDTLDAVVAEYGANYVQETCTYREDVLKWDEDTQEYSPERGIKPVCIVAQVLDRLDPALLAAVDNDTTWDGQEDSILAQFEPLANVALNVAQVEQDGRRATGSLVHATWGEAVAEAREAVGLA